MLIKWQRWIQWHSTVTELHGHVQRFKRFFGDFWDSMDFLRREWIKIKFCSSAHFERGIGEFAEYSSERSIWSLIDISSRIVCLIQKCRFKAEKCLFKFGEVIFFLKFLKWGPNKKCRETQEPSNLVYNFIFFWIWWKRLKFWKFHKKKSVFSRSVSKGAKSLPTELH